MQKDDVHLLAHIFSVTASPCSLGGNPARGIALWLESRGRVVPSVEPVSVRGNRPDGRISFESLGRHQCMSVTRTPFTVRSITSTDLASSRDIAGTE
jgi:hypothetical protein